MATLDLHRTITHMPTTTTDRSDWTPERIDRLARGMLPFVFPDRGTAPAPAAALPSGAAQLQQIGLNC